MFDRLKQLPIAFKIDSEMVKMVKSGIEAQPDIDKWGKECWILAETQKRRIIDAKTYQWLSPAGKTLLPDKLLII